MKAINLRFNEHGDMMRAVNLVDSRTGCHWNINHGNVLHITSEQGAEVQDAVNVLTTAGVPFMSEPGIVAKLQDESGNNASVPIFVNADEVIMNLPGDMRVRVQLIDGEFHLLAWDLNGDLVVNRTLN